MKKLQFICKGWGERWLQRKLAGAARQYFESPFAHAPHELDRSSPTQQAQCALMTQE